MSETASTTCCGKKERSNAEQIPQIFLENRTFSLDMRRIQLKMWAKVE
jgi:hypothetical protein